jgi:hypothetical protein
VEGWVAKLRDGWPSRGMGGQVESGWPSRGMGG